MQQLALMVNSQDTYFSRPPPHQVISFVAVWTFFILEFTLLCLPYVILYFLPYGFISSGVVSPIQPGLEGQDPRLDRAQGQAVERRNRSRVEVVEDQPDDAPHVLRQHVHPLHPVGPRQDRGRHRLRGHPQAPASHRHHRLKLRPGQRRCEALLGKS